MSMLEEWNERISKTKCLKCKIINKLDVIEIHEGREKIEFDFGS